MSTLAELLEEQKQLQEETDQVRQQERGTAIQ